MPDDFQLDELYAKLSVKAWVKVKTEKIDWAEFWAKLKVTKYSNDKEWLESLALDEGDGKAVVGGHKELG